jgi:cell division transport system permease protein
MSAGTPPPLLPRGSAGDLALFAVMAMMAFLACLALAGTLAAQALAAQWAQGLSGEATVQIPGTAADAETQAVSALNVVSAAPGVASAERLSAEASAALLKPWLGDAALQGLPLPILIAVRLAPGAVLDAEALRAALAPVAPDAMLDDHGRWNRALSASARAIRAGAAAILILIVLTAGAVVAFAVRASLQSHRAIVDVLNMIGAEPAYVAGEVQRRYLTAGFAAGLAGLGAALAFGLVIAAIWPSDALPGFGAPGWVEVLALLCVPAAAALLSMSVARLTVLRVLARPSGAWGGS